MSRKSLHTILALLFAISSASGLVYQIAWFKYLSLFLGNTTYAQTVVLAAFMGGLALGSMIWGRTADRTSHPVRVYAFLEIGIAAYGFAFPTFFNVVQDLVIAAASGANNAAGDGTILVLKLVVGMIVLLPPTILMGGTLPILVRFITDRLEQSGHVVATLYFLNSLGAVLGSVLGGFFLLRLIGLHATIMATAVVSSLIGLLAFLLQVRPKEPQPHLTDATNLDDVLFPAEDVRRALLVAGLSGAASMIYEVTWVRLLIPVLGSSVYSFSLMLVGFISGITVGSLIVSAMIGKTERLKRMLIWCQFGVVFSMLCSLFLFARIPYAFWTISSFLAKTESTYPVFLVLQFGFVLVLMFIPTVFLGMSLPLSARIAARGFSALGRGVGTVFAVNTAGTVGGALLAGLFLMPVLGVRHTVEIGIILNLFAGLLFVQRDDSWSVRTRWVVAGSAGVLLFGALGLVAPWGKGMMLAGVFRQVNARVDAPPSYADFVAAADRTEVLYYREGTTATVGVVRVDTRDGRQEVLIINGKADASSRGDLATQVTLAQLPLLLHPHPTNILVVGLGSGVTVGSVLRHPIERVECVEISPEVVEASSFFSSVNGSPLNDPRTHLVQEDALVHLKLGSRPYDIIISEPSNPWIAGVGNLFTTEFFSLCRDRLSASGLMVQWFHLYEMDDELFRLTLRTFRSVFPSVTLWQSQRNDVILIGSNELIAADLPAIRRKMSIPAVAEDLRRIGIEDIATVFSLQMLSNAAVGEYVGAGRVNSEDRPYLEYEAPRAFFVNVGVGSLPRVDERMVVAGRRALLIDGHPLTAEERRRVGLFHTQPNRGNVSLGYSLLRSYQERSPGDRIVLDRLASVANSLDRSEEELEFRGEIARRAPDDPQALAQLAWTRFLQVKSRTSALSGIDVSDIIGWMHRSISLSRDTADQYRVQLADIYFNIGEFEKASDNYARALAIRQANPADPNLRDDALYLQIARSLMRLGKSERALGYALLAAQTNPGNREAVDFVYDRWAAPRLFQDTAAQRKMHENETETTPSP